MINNFKDVIKENLCICGGSLVGARAREHVVPIWLQKLQEIQSENQCFALFDTEGTPQELREQSLNKFLLGLVCKTCNNEWMSNLEMRVASILRSLFFDPSLIVDLQDADRLILARWVSKTAFCLDAALQLERKVPQRHLKQLWRHEDRLPQGVLVTSASSPFSVPFDFLQKQDSFSRTIEGNLVSQEARLKKKFKASYKIGLQFGHLVIIASFWPNLYEHVTLAKGMHEIVWSDRVTSYDRSLNEDCEPFSDSAEFLHSAITSIGTSTRELHHISANTTFHQIRLDHSSDKPQLRGGRKL